MVGFRKSSTDSDQSRDFSSKNKQWMLKLLGKKMFGLKVYPLKIHISEFNNGKIAL